MIEERRILLISSDPNFRQKASNFLARRNLKVTYLRTHQELGTWSLFNSCAMVICDYNLKDWDGYSFLCAIQERNVQSRLVLVVDDISVKEECPNYYGILDGLISKKSFELMLPPILDCIQQNSLEEEPFTF